MQVGKVKFIPSKIKSRCRQNTCRTLWVKSNNDSVCSDMQLFYKPKYV